MNFIYDNMAVFCVAAVSSALVWIFGGIRGDLLTSVVPWLALFLVQIIFFFPQRHADESIFDARSRVWKAIKKDPLVWAVSIFFVLLAIPFVNNALCPGCDRAIIAAGIKPGPAVPFLPFCVNRLDHLNVCFWFVMALLSMVAVRHSLCNRGKRMVLETIVWNGFALAIFGFVQAAAGAPGPLWTPSPSGEKIYFFSTFGYPNMAGDYFTTLFALAVGLWRWHHEVTRMEEDGVEHRDRTNHGRFWRANYCLIPAAIFYFAALNTLSRASIMLVTLLAILFFLHTFTVFLSRMNRMLRVKRGVCWLALLGVIVFCSTVFMPDDVRREVNGMDADDVLQRVSGKGAYHSRVASALWKDHRLFGCGGWGYSHLAVFKMTKQELKQFETEPMGAANIHNDGLQFLVEHGLVGVGLLCWILWMLFVPVAKVWSALVQSVRFMKPKDRPPRPVKLFVLPAPVFFIILAAMATFVHSMGDCPFRSPAVLTLFFVMLAALPGFLPVLKEN